MPRMTPSMQLPMLLCASHGRFSKHIDRALSVHGISLTEFLVLHQLCNAAGSVMSRVALAEAVNLSASGVTRLLNPMEKNKLVSKEKNSRDARVSLVRPTKTGMDIYREAAVTYGHSAEYLTRDLTDRQLAQLSELLARLG